VVFSDGKQTCRGLTANLSRTGLCLHSDYVVMPGTELTLKLGLPGVAEISVPAHVEWARKLRGNETLQAAHSMGVRFLQAPGPEYARFMTVIEDLAQPHGLTTRQAATEPAPAEPAPAARRQPRPAATPAPVVEPPWEPHPLAPPAGAPPVAPPAAARPVAPSAASRALDAAMAATSPAPRPALWRAQQADPRREPDEVVPAHARREVIEVPTAVAEGRHRRPAAAAGRPLLEKSLDFVVDANDLAAPSSYACSLSTARVAWLLEEGAAQALAPSLRGGMASVGVSLEVSVPQQPVTAGTALSVVVSLVELSPDRRTLYFEIEIADGDRRVASGRHVRALVEPPAS
jgi:predicted thioesterase